jgi:hypothetical protein
VSIIDDHQHRITRCTSCQAPIVFLTTKRGSNMPVDADSVKPEDRDYEAGRHIPHFAVCPHASQHRKPRR